MSAHWSWRGALGVAAMAAALSAGCHREGPAERAGRQIDEAAERAGDAVRTAGETAKDAVD